MSKYFRNALWLLPVGVTFTDIVGSVIRVEGISMQPTLNPEGSYQSDWVIVDKFSIKLLHKYKRGDVVVLWAPESPHERIVKRLIGVEQDTVYVPDTFGLQRIPQVHVALIEGRVTHIVWPPWRIQRVQSKVPSRRLVPEYDPANGGQL